MMFKQTDNAGAKPPKTNMEEAPPKSTVPSSVISTDFVDAYSLLQDKRTAVGKCGLSLISNQSAKTHEIILHNSKREIIARGKLNPEFKFILNLDSSASFSDDRKQDWVVHFKTVGSIQGFAEKIKKLGAKVSSWSREFPEYEGLMDAESNANILTEMAKLKKLPFATLPSILKSIVTDPETNETEVGKKPTVKIHHKNSNSSSGDTVSNKPPNESEGYVFVNGKSLPVSPIKSAIPTPATVFNPNFTINLPHTTTLPDLFNSFITENRTHNCELRLNMTQLSSKLDTILTKLDKSTTKNYVITDGESHAVIAEKEQQIREYKQLHENLQKQNDTLSQSCAVSDDIIKDLQDQVNKLKLQFVECNENLENKILLLDNEKSTVLQQLKTISDLQTTINGLKFDHTLIDVESDLVLNELQSLQKEIATRNVKLSAFLDFLKQSMNSLYQEIMNNFEEEISYNGKQIKAAISQIVKQTTLGIIEEFKKEFNYKPCSGDFPIKTVP